MAINNEEDSAPKSKDQRHNSSSAIKGVQRRRQKKTPAHKCTYIYIYRSTFLENILSFFCKSLYKTLGTKIYSKCLSSEITLCNQLTRSFISHKDCNQQVVEVP
jgi:hypothetical protein